MKKNHQRNKTVAIVCAFMHDDDIQILLFKTLFLNLTAYNWICIM